MKSPVILIRQRPKRAAAKGKVYNERSTSQRTAPTSRKRVMASESESEGSDSEASAAAASEEEESASDIEPTDESTEDEEEEDEDEEYEEEKKNKKKRATASRKPRSSSSSTNSRSGKKVIAGRKATTTAAQPKKRQKPSTVSGNRTIHRVNQVMPVLPLRQVQQHKRDTAHLSPYSLARERLHVSAVPDSLPCREDEFVNIMGYIESAIQEATGTCVYISGVPGTGKTATVLEVIRYLQHQAEQKEIADFDFVEINGMKLTDPNQAYSILWECIERSSNANHDGKRKRYTPAHALQMLEAKFSKQSNDQRTT